MKRVNLLAGGPKQQWAKELQDDIQAVPGQWIGVDKGALYLLEQQIIPSIAVGDFDSLTLSQRQSVKNQIANIYQAQPEKDETDTQLALTLAINELKADQIVIYGATGGRLDHFLANLWLVLEKRYANVISKISLRDLQNTITYFEPGDYTIKKESDKKYLAFVPLGRVSGLNLWDAKYQLRDYQTEVAISWASNEFVGETTHFDFQSGILAVIQSCD